mmetsp:Transcript_9008/g.21464  ORF Transcript_9008/g.21464 Transcript_9008/m.21464 type:complete len:219 (+) Transcript_9008:2377-3033(+)
MESTERPTLWPRLPHSTPAFTRRGRRAPTVSMTKANASLWLSNSQEKIPSVTEQYWPRLPRKTNLPCPASKISKGTGAWTPVHCTAERLSAQNRPYRPPCMAYLIGPPLEILCILNVSHVLGWSRLHLIRLPSSAQYLPLGSRKATASPSRKCVARGICGALDSFELLEPQGHHADTRCSPDACTSTASLTCTNELGSGPVANVSPVASIMIPIDGSR